MEAEAGAATITAIGRPKVLIVDDDHDIRETLADVLGDEGFSVTTAENGQAALSALGAGELPQVILLDLMMPVMSGSEFREVQLADPRIASVPVVVMSAAERGRAIAAEMRANGFVQKPPDIDTLVTMIRRYC